MASVENDKDPRLPADDAVITFRTDRSGISGRLVRLGITADTILARHAAPDAASETLAHALALSALLGSALPGEGKVILQARSDGAVTFLVADYEAPGQMRGYVRFDAEKIADLEAEGRKSAAAGSLSTGHLAITVEQGQTAERYQGVVAIDGGSLSDVATRYFEDSEGLATFVRLAVARHFKAGDGIEPSGWHWRAGGMMLQHVAAERSASASVQGKPAGADDEDWVRVRMLGQTIEDHELLDPTLTPERLLIRLFHEEGVIIEKSRPLTSYCRCSRERVLDVLKSFGSKELSDMLDEAGQISVTCEFCATKYAFDPADIGAGDHSA